MLSEVRPSSAWLGWAVASACLLLLLYQYVSNPAGSQPSSILNQPVPSLVDSLHSAPSTTAQHYRGLLLVPSDTDTCAAHPATFPSAQLFEKRPDTCPGQPSRPARPLVPDLPLMYAHQPFMDHSSSVAGPSCWSSGKYKQWQAGELPTYPLSRRTEALLSHVMFSIVTGQVNHRSRADIIMCTYAQQIKYGRFWFHSDGDDDELRLPLLGSVEGDGKGGKGPCDHSCSERKWVTGLNETLRLVEADPTVHWLMVGDDDTFIAPKHLAELTAQYHYTKPYLVGSVHYKLDGDPNKHGLYGGAGFLISRQLALNIRPHFHRCYNYHYTQSDLFLSRCLIELGQAILVDRLEMGSQPPRYYIEQKDDCVEMIRPGLSKGATYHYVRPWQDFYYLYMLYLAFVD